MESIGGMLKKYPRLSKARCIFSSVFYSVLKTIALAHPVEENCIILYCVPSIVTYRTALANTWPYLEPSFFLLSLELAVSERLLYEV